MNQHIKNSSFTHQFDSFCSFDVFPLKICKIRCFSPQKNVLFNVFLLKKMCFCYFFLRFPSVFFHFLLHSSTRFQKVEFRTQFSSNSIFSTKKSEVEANSMFFLSTFLLIFFLKNNIIFTETKYCYI
jgi:hypothetical protein